MIKFSNNIESINESIELSGKNAFNIFLSIIEDSEYRFIKHNYLNISDYSYFFTTDKINDNSDIIDILSHKTSLQTAYLTLSTISDKRLSFYFGIKNYSLFYGFYDEDSNYVYKVGVFKCNLIDFKNLTKHKSCKNIKGIIENSNLKNMNLLKKVKKDFETFFEKFESTPEIMDEFRIQKSFDIGIFTEEDLNDMKLTYTLELWARKFDWKKNFIYYSHITDKFVHFYIKIKSF